MNAYIMNHGLYLSLTFADSPEEAIVTSLVQEPVLGENTFFEKEDLRQQLLKLNIQTAYLLPDSF